MPKLCLPIGLSIVILTFLLAYTNNSLITFLKVALINSKKIGAFSPCSRTVAQEVSSCIAHNYGPLSVLEVGAGTGALTGALIKKLNPDDLLDLIEIIPEYCSVLQKQFGQQKNVSIQQCSILDWQPTHSYDFIICSLPFNIFSPKKVKKILTHLQKLIKPGGTFSYVELMWLTHIKKYFLPIKRRARLENTLTIMARFKKDYGIKTVSIYWNITPIYVHHLRLTHSI